MTETQPDAAGQKSLPELVYLASPYTSGGAMQDTQEDRWRQVCEVAAQMAARGIHVFSPIAHTHPIAIEMNRLGSDTVHGWDLWGEFDLNILHRCDKLVVALIDGWDESQGIAHEVEYARQRSIPVHFTYDGVHFFTGIDRDPDGWRLNCKGHLEA